MLDNLVILQSFRGAVNYSTEFSIDYNDLVIQVMLLPYQFVCEADLLKS